MKRKIYTVLFLCFIVAGISSCKKNKDDAPCSVAWASELSAEMNAMATAAQAYATNPTTANCNAYKQAAQAYLNALSPYGDCTLLTGQQRIAWENALADAQESLDNMEC
jgi:beta-mannanase